MYGRNESNILDLALTFDDLGVNIPDLEEYVQHIEVAPAKDVPTYPAPSQDNLNHLRPGSKEVLHRPLHVYDYLPAMYPEMEEEEEAGLRTDQEETGDMSGSSSAVTTPTGKRLHGGRSEPGLTPKQSEDGCPLREISSVIMTTGGFLSPCREGKLPERGKIPEPEERRMAERARRLLSDDADRSSGEYGVNIKQEPGAEGMVNIKQEPGVYDGNQDYDKMIMPQEIHGSHGRGSKRYTTSDNIERIMDAVIERGMKETSRHGGAKNPDYSDGDADVEMAADVKPVIIKKEGDKRPPGRPKKNAGAAAASKKNEASDLFSAPQHFTASAKTPPKQKMARIPKITEEVSLPSPSSLMSGISGMPGMGMGSNPLIPNLGMNLYGFGNIPASLLPGFNPGLMNMAMMQQQAAASQAANTSRDTGSDSAVTLDDELEEGEISPPDTPDVSTKVKQEVVEPEPVKIKKEVDDRSRQEEKEREAEIARRKEKERIEREREKQREEDRQKLLLLSKERERLQKEKEEEKVKEKREKADRERDKSVEKEKKKSKKEKKDKDRDKSKKDKKKEKKEKKKLKEKERLEAEKAQLFSPAPVLKIKPMGEAPTAEPATPKLVIKNLLPKQEPPDVPNLGFQPLRTGPAKTPKVTPAKVEKRTKRPSSDSNPGSVKKPRDKKLKTKQHEGDSDDNTPGIISETVGSYMDESGNKVWICPACGKQDDGSPMIGCDQCDDW